MTTFNVIKFNWLSEHNFIDTVLYLDKVQFKKNPIILVLRLEVHSTLTLSFSSTASFEEQISEGTCTILDTSQTKIMLYIFYCK